MGWNKPIEQLDERHLVSEGTSFSEVTNIVSKVTEQKAPRLWWILFGISTTVTGILGLTIATPVIRPQAAMPGAVRMNSRRPIRNSGWR